MQGQQPSATPILGSWALGKEIRHKSVSRCNKCPEMRESGWGGHCRRVVQEDTVRR